MPPHGSLPDEAVAAIMAYAYTTPLRTIKNSFNSHTAPHSGLRR